MPYEDRPQADLTNVLYFATPQPRRCEVFLILIERTSLYEGTYPSALLIFLLA